MSAPDPSAKGRRWVTLGEIVAAAGLIIAGLSLYLGWSERRADEAQRQADKADARSAAAEQRRHVGLVATEAGGEVLTFAGVACALQSTDISFPTALGVAPQNTVLDHRIEAEWFAKALLAAVGTATEGRLPVLIDSQCVGADGDRAESAIYDIPYRIESRFLRGRTIRLRGLILRQNVGAGQGSARLDAAWQATKPNVAAKRN